MKRGIKMQTGYKVGDFMTQKPIHVGPQTKLQECAKVMSDHRVSTLLILDKDEIKGIITEQDIIRKSIAMNKNPMDLKVEDIMETSLITTDPLMDIQKALNVMNQKNIRHLPVLEEDKLVGLITIKDILKIQPQLFALVAETINVREFENKLNSAGINEGVCNICGEFSENIINQGDITICRNCKE
jgi:CBS domain-containing protein